MEKLEIIKENVTAAYEAGDESQKGLLKKLFPNVFAEDPYLVACHKLGINPRPALEDRSDLDWVAADAFYRLTICIRAKNMIAGKIWKPVYDGNEKHWFPRWVKNDAGFGLTAANCAVWVTSTSVGERLEYRTRELLLEGVEEFNVYYQDLLIVQHDH